MKRSKPPWYMWGSFIAWFILMLHSDWYVNNKKITLNTWTKKSKAYNSAQIEKLFTLIVLFITPFIIFAVFDDVLGHPTGTLNIVWSIAKLAILYFIGVYAAYRHYCWRKKNIPPDISS